MESLPLQCAEQGCCLHRGQRLGNHLGNKHYRYAHEHRPTLAAVVNNAPAVASIGSTLSVVKNTDILGGILTLTDAAGAGHALVLGTPGATDTLANLKATINGLGYGITANVNGQGRR